GQYVPDPINPVRYWLRQYPAPVQVHDHTTLPNDETGSVDCHPHVKEILPILDLSYSSPFPLHMLDASWNDIKGWMAINLVQSWFKKFCFFIWLGRGNQFRFHHPDTDTFIAAGIYIAGIL